MPRLNSSSEDFHLHLYGSLGAEDLFACLGERQERLPWFEKEWEKLTGSKVSNYQGTLQNVRAHFEVSKQVSFAEFQARFNLAIALFPALKHEEDLWQRVLTREKCAGIKKASYRTLIPPRFSSEQQQELILKHLAGVEKFQPLVEATVIFSLDRDIKEIKRTLPLLPHSKYCSGIDFCGDEEVQENFYTFVDFIKDLPDVHLHIGETWRRIGIEESLKRTEYAVKAGIKYLGHTTSTWAAESYLKTTVDRTKLRHLMAENNVTVETCPASNFYLCPGIKKEELPLVALEKSSVNFYVCRDDPGIFCGTLEVASS